MDPKFKIDGLRKGDTPLLVKVLKDGGEFRGGEVEVAAELMETALEKGEAASGYYFAVARDDQGPVAFACWGPTPCTEHTWDLYWIATAPRARRTGVARALVDVSDRHISEHGGKLVVIETADNKPYEAARAFYKALGCAEVARIPDFYKEGEGKVVFLKKL